MVCWRELAGEPGLCFQPVHLNKRMTMKHSRLAFVALMLGVAVTASAQSAAPNSVAVPTGEVKGSAWVHTTSSLLGSALQADVVLPAEATGSGLYSGKLKDVPALLRGKRVPVVVFMHGSSGLALKAIGEWQQWLARQGIASVAPDSFALPDHVTYKSPISKGDYERIHALRASEIAPTLQALQSQSWADLGKLVLAGTSEGAVPVARYGGTEFAAKILFAWSCEANYFVDEPRNAFSKTQPVLNIISQTDPFFSPGNAWLGNNTAKGHCADALKENARASVLLIPGAPHTLLNLPAARDATAGFLREVLRP